jgi:RNA polymerase sigma factor (sigma-70 family)
MTSPATISDWLKLLQDDEADAVQAIWLQFFDRLVALADQQIRSMSTMIVDGEDVALSVFQSVWRGAREGRFRDVKSLDELWWMLTAMAKRKCVDHYRRETASKRGGARASISLDSEQAKAFLELVSPEPDPAYLVAMDDSFSHFISLLHEPKQREIAVLRVQGHTIEEIGQVLGISIATVNRKLRIARQIWNSGLNNGVDVESV